MIRIGQEMFGLADYAGKLAELLSHYPLLMRSYMEQAIQNYISPLILNYHNHYNKSQHVEEIFYERTGRVIYQVETAKHFCWKATREELIRNRIFYEFKDKDLVQLEHPFLGLIETPLVLRALRHGVMLKLEDLYMPFI